MPSADDRGAARLAAALLLAALSEAGVARDACQAREGGGVSTERTAEGLLPRLRALVAAAPAGSSVTLPLDWLREQLEALDRTQPAGGVAELTVEAVAARYGRAPSTVRAWCLAGRLAGAYRLRGREWRIPAGALQAFLEAERPAQTAGLSRKAGSDLGAWRRLAGSAGGAAHQQRGGLKRERTGEPVQHVEPNVVLDPALDVRDRRESDAGTVGQFGLREAGGQASLAESQQ
jgi:hypothetical protein